MLQYHYSFNNILAKIQKQRVENLSTPHDSIACPTTFSSNNLLSVKCYEFHIAVEVFRSTLLHVLLHFIQIYKHLFQVPLNQAEV